MPLPIAHSALGLTGYYALKQNKLSVSDNQELLLLGLCILLANAPDLDFLPGIVIGNPGLFHHGASHSILLCLIIGLFTAMLVAPKLNYIPKTRIYLCSLIAIGSHPLLDYFGKDTALPLGVPLWWPFNNEYHMSSLPLFIDVQRDESTVNSFFKSIVNSNNALEAVIEFLFLGIILFALLGFKNRSSQFHSFSCFLLSALCGVFYYVIHIRVQWF